ncbi:MAG: hypothetical protein EUB_01602 [Eubacterium sp.]|uniref:HK97 gp10 family phage protein n=1 Tax=Eubacterium sp. TaxID=142586 RepID=UPI00306AF971
MMITFKHSGDFSKTISFLNKTKEKDFRKILDRYGKLGVSALSSATPTDTGLTAASWHYEIEGAKGSSTITFYNSNIQNGVPIAIILQYGHGTRNGGWVNGRDYINPAIQPVFDKITADAWKEVAT